MSHDHPLVQVALPAEEEGPSPATAPPTSARGRSVSPGAVDQSQRWRLLIATADVIADRGYAATTIESITKSAGVSKKTFYKFFATKEEAFLAAYDAVDPVFRHVTTLAAAEPNPQAMLDSMVSTYLSALAAAPSLTRLFLIEAMGATPRILRQRARTLEVFVSGVQELLTLAKAADPQIAPYSDDDVLAFLGGINELCVHHITLHGTDTLPELHPTILTFANRFLPVAPNASAAG